MSTTPSFSKKTTSMAKIATNLCLSDKDSFFHSILTSLTHSVTVQSSHLTDLVLLCTGPDGPLPVSVHSAVLSSQSPLLRDLLLPLKDPVLVLPEVKVDTLWYMLDLIYTGRCDLSKKNESFKLVQLLTSLGLHSVVHTLEMESESGHLGDQQEYLDQSMSDRRSTMDSVKLSPDSPQLQCKECGERFQENKAVEFFFHERDCVRNSEMVLPRFSIKEEPREVLISQLNPVPESLSPPQNSGHFCQMCGKKLRNPYKLREHYTSKHFYEQVLALIKDESSPSCQFCDQDLEDGDNMIYHMVRHVGVTHRKVNLFVESECGTTIILCDECQICKERIDLGDTALGNHLVQKHYKHKISDLLTQDQTACHICEKKMQNFDNLIVHVGTVHGQAMKFYKHFLCQETADDTFEDTFDSCEVEGSADRKLPNSREKPEKISKSCYICGAVIAGAGRGWRFPLYAHFSRRHFAHELIRDFGNLDLKCSVCGKDGEAKSSFVAHLGAKHRLVEKYLDMNILEEEELVTESPPSVVVQGDYLKHNKRKRYKPRRLQLEVTELAKKLMYQSDNEVSTEGLPNPIKTTTIKPKRVKSKTNANISCPHCEKKVVIRPVLQSHLLSKHFKLDCEEGIRQIFEKTGGVCPRCPGFGWSKPGTLDWTVYIHFSRKHKIAEDLEFDGGLLNQGNVQKILHRFCPD